MGERNKEKDSAYQQSYRQKSVRWGGVKALLAVVAQCWVMSIVNLLRLDLKDCEEQSRGGQEGLSTMLQSAALRRPLTLELSPVALQVHVKVPIHI